MKHDPEQKNNIKATSQGLRVLPIVVLAAVLLYFAIQVYNYFSDPLTTTLVYESQAEDVVSLDGWLVRDEETLPAQSGTVSHALEEGQKVGAGQTVATVYAEASSLQTVSRIETLKLQLQQLEFTVGSQPLCILVAGRGKERLLELSHRQHRHGYHGHPPFSFILP